MPFTSPTDPQTRRRRALIIGETGSGKTAAFRTFPGPKFVMIFPGEKGQDTLLKGDGTPIDADMTVRVCENADASGKQMETSTAVIEQVRKETIAALRGDYGPITTFCGDGLHKLNGYVLDALSGGQFFAGSEVKTASNQNPDVLDPRVFGQAERWLFDYLSLVNQARKLPYAVFTSWDADKAVRKASKALGEKWQDMPTAKMPALFAGASRNVIGEFGCVLHASVGKVEGVEGNVHRWQTKADSKVIGCQIKAPAEVVEKVPKFVRADWRELAKYLEG